MRTALSLLFLSLFSKATGTLLRRRSQELGCASGEEEAIFTIILDDSAVDNGWSLVCDDTDTNIWDVPAGSLTDTEEGSFITNTACISTNATCGFSIVDTAGNGLKEDVGWYFLMFGATTVAASAEEDTSEFSERLYCFGVDCDVSALEETDTYIDDLDSYNYYNDDEYLDGCANGEEEAVLSVVLDANAQETGWTLTCDDVLLWNAPTGSLSDSEGTFIMQKACVSNTTSLCEFRITDTGGDGLVGDLGWYYLRFGATTVAVSSQEETEAFTVRTYCFGTLCDYPPLENASDDYYAQGDAYYYEDVQKQECSSDDLEASLTLALDENARETGWTLECDGTLIWNAPPRSLSDPAGTFITQTACVSPNATCEFTLFDTAGDGLGEDYGWYYLRIGATTVAVSSEEESTDFSERRYCFGPDCVEVPLEIADILDGDDDYYSATEEPVDRTTPDEEPFGGVEEPVDRTTPDEEPFEEVKVGEQNTGDNDGVNIGVVVGSVLGGLCLVSLAAFFVLRRRVQQEDK